MFKDVFIIGAGASVPYGFPTGFEILQEIKSQKLINLPNPLLEQMHEVLYKKKCASASWPFVKEKLIKKVNDEILDLIRNSCVLSIDQFLKNHSDNTNLQTIIKMLLSYIILRCEEDAFRNRSSKDEELKHLGQIDWIQYFLTKIDIYCEDNSELQEYLKSMTFISFNYDRVLEYFLFKYLKYDRGFTDDKALEVISMMNILHINGQIPSSYNIVSGQRDVQYKDIAGTIQTVWEDSGIEDIAMNKRAKRFIKESKRIFILGTSYIPDNNKAIGLTKEAINGNFYVERAISYLEQTLKEF